MAKISTHLNGLTMYETGFQDIENVLKTLSQQALSESIFPGCAVGILIDRPDKKMSYVWTAGFTDQSKNFNVSKQTFYDLASLTKPLVTTLSILALIEMGKIDFCTSLKVVFQGSINPEKNQITIGDLLVHRSGLPAHRSYFLNLNTIEGYEKRRAKIVEYILDEPLEQQPGTVTVYSDLGFILLGYIIERITSQSLEVFWSKNIAIPLLLQDRLVFQPTLKNIGLNRIAATEECQWTRKVLCGEVHDDNCRSLGGIAGHAGLFGTVEGVIDLCGTLLRIWRGEKILSLCSPRLLQKTFERKEDMEWCYGFDTPTGEKSSSGHYFSQRTVGHLGFTGTSFWIDLCRGIVIVLLTNRVNPSRNNEKIKAFRPVLHDTLMEKLVKLSE
jgi:CubicO group peptidase (beta-lactamase class C family)